MGDNFISELFRAAFRYRMNSGQLSVMCNIADVTPGDNFPLYVT